MSGGSGAGARRARVQLGEREDAAADGAGQRGLGRSVARGERAKTV